MTERRDVVLTDSVRIAKSTMGSDWGWTPQRIKDALLVTGRSQIPQMRSSGKLRVFVAGDYPSSEEVYAAIDELDSLWGNPFAQSSL